MFDERFGRYELGRMNRHHSNYMHTRIFFSGEHNKTGLAVLLWNQKLLLDHWTWISQFWYKASRKQFFFSSVGYTVYDKINNVFAFSISRQNFLNLCPIKFKSLLIDNFCSPWSIEVLYQNILEKKLKMFKSFRTTTDENR